MIIDTHAHVGRSYIALSKFKPIENMLEIYNDCGIVKACISHFLLAYDPPAGNDEVYEIVKKYPDLFIGFGVISPRWSPNAADEVDRCVNDLNMKGIKLHPNLNNYAADSPIVYPVIERAQKYDIPVLFHTDHTDLSRPSRVGKIAKLFPDVSIIMAHLGVEAYYEAAFLAKELPNVYLDTAEILAQLRILRECVRIAGKEKILFGTDAPGVNVYSAIATVKFGDISEDAKKAIFYENAKKLLKL